jgi:hypothetical protein
MPQKVQTQKRALKMKMKESVVVIEMDGRFVSLKGVERKYKPIACWHEENLRKNKHGFGLDIDLRENICSTADLSCHECGFMCRKKPKLSHSIPYDVKLIRTGIGSGFFVYTLYGDVFEIKSQTANKFFSKYDLPSPCPVSIREH